MLHCVLCFYCVFILLFSFYGYYSINICCCWLYAGAAAYENRDEDVMSLSVAVTQSHRPSDNNNDYEEIPSPKSPKYVSTVCMLTEKTGGCVNAETTRGEIC